jgi:hypothetical protein
LGNRQIRYFCVLVKRRRLATGTTSESVLGDTCRANSGASSVALRESAINLIKTFLKNIWCNKPIYFLAYVSNQQFLFIWVKNEKVSYC